MHTDTETEQPDCEATEIGSWPMVSPTNRRPPRQRGALADGAGPANGATPGSAAMFTELRNKLPTTETDGSDSEHYAYQVTRHLLPGSWALGWRLGKCLVKVYCAVAVHSLLTMATTRAYVPDLSK